MFNMVKVVWPAFAPTSILWISKKVAIQSAIDVFPGVNIAGCLFHLVKNFKKQIAAHGLSARNQEPEFSLRAKMLILLKNISCPMIKCSHRSSIGLKHIMSALQCVIQCSQFVGGPAMKDPCGKTERITLQRLLIIDFTLLWAWIIRM
uniref:MULE transposase domain-containing protein n=1 Tax=Ditylenchus dipsaci TaxID=166011 RepID=A0A915DIC7_9BILA